jgi:hypothetical protein
MDMRRLNSIALGMALLASLSLHAQMRGSMGGGRSFSGGQHSSSGFRSSGPSRSFAGPGRGFASGPRGFAPGPRSFGSAPRSFAPRTFAPRTFSSTATTRNFSPVRRSFVTFPGRGPGFHRFHHRFFFRDRFFFRGCFGCFSPFFFSSGFFFGDPFLFDPFYAGYPGSYGYPPPPPAPVYVNSDNGNDVALAAEVQRLTDEVDDLREEARDRDRSESRTAAPNTSITAKAPGMPVEFIFRDGRRISAQNYAIAGETLWILDEHAARKFALSELDVDATQQSNAARGIDLHIPAAHQ